VYRFQYPADRCALTLRIGHGEARYREFQKFLLENRRERFNNPDAESKI